MKLSPVFRWAEQTNFDADASGLPWRTGSFPTKVTTLPVNRALQGHVPADRLPAVEENLVKSVVAKNVQDARRAVFSNAQRVPLLAAENAPMPMPGGIFYSAVNTTETFRDSCGAVLLSGALGASVGSVQRNRAALAPNGTFGLMLASGSTENRRVVFSGTAISPVIDVPGPPSLPVFGYGNIGRNAPNAGLLFVAATIAAVVNVHAFSASAAFTTTALAGAPAGATNSVFFTDPVDNSFYCAGSVAGNTWIYKLVGAAWNVVYNSASLFGQGVLYSPPAYDASTNEWVWIVNISATYAVDATATRLRTAVYRSPRVLLQNVVVQKALISRFGIGVMQDLGDGVIWAIGTRFAKALGATTLTTLGTYSSTDYGLSWNQCDRDLIVMQMQTTNSFDPQMATSQFIDMLGATYLYPGISITVNELLVLPRPGADQTLFT